MTTKLDELKKDYLDFLNNSDSFHAAKTFYEIVNKTYWLSSSVSKLEKLFSINLNLGEDNPIVYDDNLKEYLAPIKVCDIAIFLTMCGLYERAEEHFNYAITRCDDWKFKLETQRRLALTLLKYEDESKNKKGIEILETLSSIEEQKNIWFDDKFQKEDFWKYEIYLDYEKIYPDNDNFFIQIGINACLDLVEEVFIPLLTKISTSDGNFSIIDQKLSIVKRHYNEIEPLLKIRYLLIKTHRYHLKNDNNNPSCQDCLRQISQLLDKEQEYLGKEVEFAKYFDFIRHFTVLSYFGYYHQIDNWQNLYLKCIKISFKVFWVNAIPLYTRGNEETYQFLCNLLEIAEKEKELGFALQVFSLWEGWLAKLYNIIVTGQLSHVKNNKSPWKKWLAKLHNAFLVEPLSQENSESLFSPEEWLRLCLSGTECLEQVPDEILENYMFGDKSTIYRFFNDLTQEVPCDINNLSLASTELILYLICHCDDGCLAIIKREGNTDSVKLKIKESELFLLNQHLFQLGEEETEVDSLQLKKIKESINSNFWEPLHQSGLLTRIQTIHFIINGAANIIPFDLGKPEAITLYYYPDLHNFFSHRENITLENKSYPQAKQSLLFYHESFYKEGNKNEPKEDSLIFSEVERYCIEKIAHNAFMYSKPSKEKLGEQHLCLHIASHGWKDEFVHLKFLQEDEKLGSYKFLNMGTLKGMVVFFSACVMGHLSEQQGEPLGIVPALLAAGVRYVIGNLISIRDDLSALLSILFHYNWKKGATPDIALEQAKEQLKTGEWPQELIPLIEKGFTQAWKKCLDYYLSANQEFPREIVAKIHYFLPHHSYSLKKGENKEIDKLLAKWKNKKTPKDTKKVLNLLHDEDGQKYIIDVLVKELIENRENLEGIDTHIVWCRGYGGPYQKS